jgi:hypothetical protein
MSYVYRQEYVETGNIIEPGWWNANQKEIAGEFNGGLDSDNLPLASISQTMLADNACNSITTETGSSSNAVTPSVETTDWQASDPGGDEIGSVTIECTVDALLIVEWSGEWQWDGISTAGSYVAGTYTEDSAEFRITVDGVEVATTGPLGDQRWKDATYLVAAHPVAPGPHTVTVWVRIAERAFDGLGVTDKATNSMTINNRELIITQRKR